MECPPRGLRRGRLVLGGRPPTLDLIENPLYEAGHAPSEPPPVPSPAPASTPATFVPAAAEIRRPQQRPRDQARIPRSAGLDSG
ncbi:hypothetical protein IscW_ISCW023070 [Ixodes scapularis]|uniref:Uncharacterized protein n=1 Tax=Ixodes scapularis TaxID=6945 RepID=B7QLY3_IXOSC|nr:hypothetical protein IscW_ISCW023070 [Ixodes scapularis]|eukprot:XP_002416188.1 hypothetical protein IscW_ISCW023070 [Ixodes scapularis]